MEIKCKITAIFFTHRQVLHSVICIIYGQNTSNAISIYVVYLNIACIALAQIVKHLVTLKNVNFDFMFCIDYIINKQVAQ